jgi:hypothetical protein
MIAHVVFCAFALCGLSYSAIELIGKVLQPVRQRKEFRILAIIDEGSMILHPTPVATNVSIFNFYQCVSLITTRGSINGFLRSCRSWGCLFGSFDSKRRYTVPKQ